MERKKMENDVTEFRLKDFYQACVIKTLGFQLKRLEGGDQKFKVFVFDDPDFMAEEKLGQFWDGQLKVDPKLLIQNIRDLKNRVFSEKEA